MLFGSFRRKNNISKTGGALLKPLHKVESDGSLSSRESTFTNDSLCTKSQRDLDDIVSEFDSGGSNVRRVTFNESKNKNYTHDPEYEYDGEVSWYDDGDYARFKLEAREAVQRALEEQENDTALDSFYSSLRDLYSSAQQAKKITPNADKILTAHQKQDLLLLYGEGNRIDMIGLEIHALKPVQKDTKSIRRRVYASLIQVRDDYKKGWFPEEDFPEECRFACIKQTMTSVLFAQLLAKSQSYV